MFRAYPKIMALHKEEVEGILDGPVTVQEKIDGANVSIWLGDDGNIHCGSRTRELGDDDFNGFTAYVKEHEEPLREFFMHHPGCRLYGEWLVKHTITYPDEAYKKMYLYDIYSDNDNVYAPQIVVQDQAMLLGFEYPRLFVKGEIVTLEQLKEFVGKSFIGANGEGVVVKSLDFINKFGDMVYAKLVHEKFKESNAIVFGGNNKHSEAYNEMYIVNKYCTMGRVQKIMQKLQPQVNKRLDMEHTPMIAGSCYHDMITEEIWDMIKKTTLIDFKRLQRLSYKKFIQIYHDILNNSISIADRKN